MIVTIILGIIAVSIFIVSAIAFSNGDGDIAIGLFFTAMFFMVITGVAGVIEPDEVRTACRTYCQEQDYSYDSVKTEGEDKYCVCDTSLERHLIKKNTGVIIE